MGGTEKSVVAYIPGGRGDRKESQRQRDAETETEMGKAERGTKREQRAGGGRAARVGPLGLSANCFADTRSSGPHTVVLWGVWRCPQSLKGPRWLCVRGIPSPACFPCPQRQGLEGQGPRFSVEGAELTLEDHDGATGGQEPEGPGLSPTCSQPSPALCCLDFCPWLPQPVAASSPPVRPNSLLSIPVPPRPLYLSPPFCSPLGLGSGRGAQRLSWGGGLVDY